MRLLKYFLGVMMVVLSSNVQADSSIRYVALGDSYTIGTGALPDEAWPSVITRNLQAKGCSIQLIANLGRNGWTTEDLITYELPALKKLNPTFVTILIGTNDWVHGVSPQIFEQHLTEALDELLRILPDAKKILVLTIPDFSVSPVGEEYANGRNISQGLAEFNQIILKESKARSLKVVDLFDVSKAMAGDVSLFATDGLHPSAKGYARWVKVIEPEVEQLLK